MQDSSLRRRDERQAGLRRLITGLTPALVMIALALTGAQAARGVPVPPSAQKSQKHEARRVTGLVTDVQASEITLQSKDGQTVVLAAFEDYRDRITVGSQVTAWYYPQDSGEAVLRSLDYPPETLFVPVGEIARRVHRVVLLPSSQVDDASGIYDAVREYLHNTLGWYVAPSYLGDEVRKRADRTGSTLAAMDPRTGGFDMSAYLNTTEGVIPKVASGTHSDAVLELEVIRVEAPVSRLVASWDGVEEPVAGAGMRTLAKFSMLPHKGEVSASTVELKLWDAKGNLLWRNRRGLALLEVLAGAGNRLRERPLFEILADGSRMQGWMETAFKSIGPETSQARAPRH